MCSKHRQLKQTSLGKTVKPANEILLCAHTRMKQMGGYQALINNCQDFCQQLAKDLDCTGVVTGFDVAVGGSVVTIAVGALSLAGAIIFKLVTK